MEYKMDDDVEKQPPTSDVSSVHDAAHEIAALNDHVPRQKGVFAPLWRVVEALDKYGVEARGIERVPEDERHHTSFFDNCTLWMSSNMGVTIFGIGTLGNEIWDLGFRDAALTIIFFNLLANAPVAWFSTFGKALGLRQMTIGRFSFGFWTAYIPVIFNLIACAGWSTINNIAGVSTLQAVSTEHQIPTVAAVIIIALLTLVFCFMGYKVIHLYDRYSGIPMAVIFIILAGLSGKYMDQGAWGGTGPVEAASVLSFGGTVVGSALGWVSFAADYTVNMPKETSSKKLFWVTYLGLNVPQIFCEILGAAMMTTFAKRPDYGEAFESGSVGGLLAAGFSPAKGFGKFLQVILALSVVTGNIPNIYSFCVTFQVLGRYAQAIPRPFIAIIVTIIYAVLAAVGAHSFSSVLTTLLGFLAYWLAIYSVIVAEEHLIFRKGFSGYRPDDYQTAKLLPVGIAAFVAVGVGWTGAALGMSQTWYVGAISKKIGDPLFGADIGFELGAAFTSVVYPPLRYLEKNYFKR